MAVEGSVPTPGVVIPHLVVRDAAEGFMKLLSASLLCLATSLFGQTPTPAPSDSFKSIAFLEGNRAAQGTGSAAAAVSGTYSFRLELNKHILARHSRTSDCKAQTSFDCEHGDLLYIYADGPGKPLRAIYFDSVPGQNEWHSYLEWTGSRSSGN